jgi:glycerol kinase
VTFILALDQGTTSSRAILFDHEGQIRAVAQREFRQIFPQSGWVEHDPREIWDSQRTVAGEVLREAGLTAADVAAIGITNQRETTILWDRRTGEPVHNAIVWQDRRTASFCDRLKQEGHLDTVQQKTGLVIDAYFSGSKLRWLLDNVPGARTRAEHGELAFGTVDTWLLWKLTGGALHVTDATNASRTMLYNIHARQWDDELLSLLQVPRAVLPEVRSSSEVYGQTRPELFGGRALPLAGVAGDQQAALFGQTCFGRGLAKNTYGTGCFMLMNVGTEAVASKHRLLTTVAWQLGGTTEYALEGSVFIGGAVVQWLRDGLRAIQGSGEVQRLAESVPSSGGVMFVPAFTGLGAPYWDADARGAIVGLTRGSTVAHIARAALESIAFQSAALLQAMSRDAVAAGAAPVAELRVDGGACVNDLLMQFQADLLGIPVVRPQVIETTALGAAYLAGLSCGLYRSLDELAAQWQAERTFLPTMTREQAGGLMADWEHAVRQATAR